MSEFHMCVGDPEDKRGHDFLGTGVTGCYEFPSWVMGTKLGSLEKQYALLTTEPSLFLVTLPKKTKLKSNYILKPRSISQAYSNSFFKLSTSTQNIANIGI